jgi:ribonuclease P protein component
MQATRNEIKNLRHLIKRADFLKIGRQGKKCVTYGVIMQVLPNDLGYIRVGFTVTKKLEISAVRRNRIKRRLRAAAADTLHKHAKTSCDYVLIGRPLTATRSYAALCGDLKYCLEKMKSAK